MSNNTAVDRLYEEAISIINHLKGYNETSLEYSAADYFRKALLLAAASYFEYRICDDVLCFVRECSNKSELVESFFKNKAIARQYHTWFSWESKNANSFFGLFGENFKNLMRQQVRESDELHSSISNFIELGCERNRLVHQDFATFQMEKTINEVYELYRGALLFLDFLPKELRKFSKDCYQSSS